MESSRGNLYDVFVSFRGEDTRDFIGHLFGALQRNNISVFMDDKDLKGGESVSNQILHAIEGSQIFIVVLSMNYAYSKWCLKELEMILECVQLYGKPVLPVFYDVDPSVVRNQTGSYERAFAKHERDLSGFSKTVQLWKEALTQVADLAGWVLGHG
ncbi:TIR-NBS-LRR resistance protein, partial [Trifolium medium]|nr:TIR-NBS-LRR resistance protein [Trifolium medium]